VTLPGLRLKAELRMEDALWNMVLQMQHATAE
jgi:hypothetical protein